MRSLYAVALCFVLVAGSASTSPVQPVFSMPEPSRIVISKSLIQKFQRRRHLQVAAEESAAPETASPDIASSEAAVEGAAEATTEAPTVVSTEGSSESPTSAPVAEGGMNSILFASSISVFSYLLF